MAWDVEELAIDGWRFAGLANTTLPAATGEFAADPARPGVDDIVADIDTLGGLRSLLRRGLLLDSGGDCAPSIAGTQVEIASGAVLLDGRLYLSAGATVATFSSVGTNYVYVTHTVTNDVGTAELVASTTAPTAPYVLLATVEWDGSALSDLVDRRGEHQVPSAAGTAWDSWTVGDGTDGADKYVLLDTGDALLPGLRYNVADSQLEYSHDGETWAALGTVSGTDGDLVLGDGTAQDWYLYVDVGAGAGNPAIRWSSVDSELQLSNDGSTWTTLGSGSGGGTITGGGNAGTGISVYGGVSGSLLLLRSIAAAAGSGLSVSLVGGSITLGFDPSVVGHDDLSGSGTHTHADIDAHLDATSGNPHNVTASDVGNLTAQWNANQLRGTPIAAAAPAEGQVLKLNGGQWTPADEAGGSANGDQEIYGDLSLITDEDALTDASLQHLIEHDGDHNIEIGSGPYTSGPYTSWDQDGAGASWTETSTGSGIWRVQDTSTGCKDLHLRGLSVPLPDTGQITIMAVEMVASVDNDSGQTIDLVVEMDGQELNPLGSVANGFDGRIFRPAIGTIGYYVPADLASFDLHFRVDTTDAGVDVYVSLVSVHVSYTYREADGSGGWTYPRVGWVQESRRDRGGSLVWGWQDGEGDVTDYLRLRPDGLLQVLGDLDVDGTISGTVASHAASHQHGGADEIATATPGANAVPKAGGTGKLAVGWLPTGSGNGLDADTVDTVHASALARRAGSPTAGHLAGLDADGDPTDSGIVATDVSGHLANTSNPHSVTAAQLGVGNIYGELYPPSHVTVPNYAGTTTYLDFTSWTRSLTGLTWSSLDPTKITITADGLYQLDLCLCWDNNATGYRVAGWAINTGTYPRLCAAVTGQYTSSQHAMTVRLTAGQYLRALCWQNSGGDLLLRSSGYLTRLYIARIAP